jgi:transcriptional regulator with XRE-family HTH domain
MEQLDGPLTPTKVIAARVKELRKSRGWSAADLAQAMKAVGIEWERIIVTKLETGRRASVSVEEMLALAYVLDVAVVDLVVPPWPSPLWGGTGNHASDVARSPNDPNVPNDKEPYQVTPTVTAECDRVRRLFYAYEPLPGMDKIRFMAARPPQYWPSLQPKKEGELDG